MSKTISAAAKPAVANKMLSDVVEENPQQKEIKITSPSNNIVTLPGGYITATGEVIDEAEVRELTGADEEAIAKAPNVGRALLTILQRGTVRIGEERADDKVLDSILSADRDVLLLAIFKATFGNTTIIPVYIDAVAAGNFMAMRRAAFLPQQDMQPSKLERLVELVDHHRIWRPKREKSVFDIAMASSA